MERLSAVEARRLTRVTNILHNYAEACLTERPDNLYEFSEDFFQKLIGRRSTAQSNDFKQISDTSLVDPAAHLRHVTIYERTSSYVLDSPTHVEYPKTQAQREWLTKVCKEIYFFKGFDDESITKVVDSLMFKKVQKDEIIIEKGTDVSFFYIIQEGNFHSYVTDPLTGKPTLKEIFRDWSCFGQTALLHVVPATYTLKAVAEGILWFLEGKTFKDIEYRHMYHSRQMFNYILNTVNALKNLCEDDQERLADAFEIKMYEANEIIIRDDQDPDGMYFIEKGEVSFSYYDECLMNYIEILRIGSGNSFGEMTLLDDTEKNIFRVTATEDSILAFLDKDGFNRLLRHTCSMYAFEENVSKIRIMFKEVVGLDLTNVIKERYGSI